MQLSSEQFERIVGMAAPADVAPATGDVVAPAGSRRMDRRVATRIPFGARAKIMYENPEQGGLTDTVMLQDISVQGLSFVSAEWIAIDETLVVHLKDQNNQEVPIRCKVRRCEQGGYGGVSYMVGATFEQILEQSPIQSAAASPKKAVARKRRPAAPPGGLLKKLNPMRFFGRNFDDFSTVTEGSKLSRDLLEEEEEEAEETPAQTPTAAAIPGAADAPRPRKSSIFLREDSPATAPVQEPTPQTSAIVENTQNSSINADDIAAILNAIPAEKPAVSEEPEVEVAATVELAELLKVEEAAVSVPSPAVPPPATVAVELPPAVVESVKSEPVKVEPTISEPVAVTPAAIVEPAPVTAVQPEPVKIESKISETVVVVAAAAVVSEPAPVAAVPPEPLEIESKIPETVAVAPVVVVEPAPVAVMKPEPVKVEAVIPEPMAVPAAPAVAPEPAPIAAVNPEPVKIEEAIPLPPVAVAIVEPTPVIPEPVAIKAVPVALPPVARVTAEPVKVEPKISLEPNFVRDRPANAAPPTPIKSMKSDRASASDPRKTRFRFTAEMLPTYLTSPGTAEELIPWLSFQGIGAGELPAALSHLGSDGSGASAMNVLKMNDAWAEEYRAWNKRDLHGKRFVYMWADGLKLGTAGMLVVTGATEKGERELVSLMPGERESEQSWAELLTDLKDRGLTRPPKIFVGDAKLGLWKPLRAMSAAIRQQHCWTHKTAEVRAGFPANMQARVEAKMQEIFMAPRRDEAVRPLDLFVRSCPKEQAQAAACLSADKETLLTFHDFPVEHWPFLRNANAIASIYDTIDLSAYSADGAFSLEQGLIMAFKLAQSAQKHWRKLSASTLLADVLRGTPFNDGVKAAA